MRIKYVKINRVNFIFLFFFIMRKNYVLEVFPTTTTISPYAESERRGEERGAESEKRLYIKSVISTSFNYSINILYFIGNNFLIKLSATKNDNNIYSKVTFLVA